MAIGDWLGTTACNSLFLATAGMKTGNGRIRRTRILIDGGKKSGETLPVSCGNPRSMHGREPSRPYNKTCVAREILQGSRQLPMAGEIRSMHSENGKRASWTLISINETWKEPVAVVVDFSGKHGRGGTNIYPWES